MKQNSRHSLLKALLQSLPHRRPFGLAELSEHGVSPVLAAKYAKSGWLERLEHGTYGYPNDTLNLDECLLYLQKRSPGLHVGGKTALSWQGIRHNVSPRSKIYLWGELRFKLPEWLTSRFPGQYYQRVLFDQKRLQQLLPDEGYVQLAEHAVGICVSSRERALLEVLNEVGVTQDLEEAMHLFESFTSMRLEVIGALLASCTRIKTVRLFLQLAEQSNTIDSASLLERFDLKLGSKSRWTRRLPNGTLLTLK
jgi:hypothetical protein